jgi:hypothetical protein
MHTKPGQMWNSFSPFQTFDKISQTYHITKLKLWMELPHRPHGTKRKEQEKAVNGRSHGPNGAGFLSVCPPSPLFPSSPVSLVLYPILQPLAPLVAAVSFRIPSPLHSHPLLWPEFQDPPPFAPTPNPPSHRLPRHRCKERGTSPETLFFFLALLVLAVLTA